MAIPDLNITFKAAAQSTIETSQGAKTAMLILLDSAVPTVNPAIIEKEADIPASLSSANKGYISDCLLGNDFKPKKIIAYVLTDSDDIDDALNYTKSNKVDWLCMPTATTESCSDTIKAFVIAQKAYKNDVRAVLPNCEAASEYCVNFISAASKGSTAVTAEALTPRICGILCGTDSSKSITYAVIPELTACTAMTNAEMETAQSAGKLFLIFDGEKVKLSRGINSLVSPGANQNASFKKIKIIELITAIKNDLRIYAQDSFIGKYGNSYDNRCLLMSAIMDYFNELKESGLISDYSVTFDIEAIKAAMTSASISYQNLTNEEIAQKDFGTGVYLKISLNVLDAVEDINITVEI